MDFSSIPNEPLLQILEHVDDDELYVLPLLCRRLNHLAIPILLERQGIIIADMKAGAVRLTLPEQLKTLAAFRTAFFVNSIALLSCEFRPMATDAPGAFHSYLRQVANLITRPIPVGFQVLGVDLWGSCTLASPSEEEHLCEELFTRSDSCQELSIRDGNGDTRVYCRAALTSDAPPSNARQILNLMGRTRARGKPHLFSRLDPTLYWGQSHSKARRSSYTLHTYKLNDHQKLLPENLPQTLSSLKTVGNLTLPSSGLWGTVWSDILPRIGAAARELNTVDIDPTGMFLHDLVKFISMLPKIMQLIIHVPNDPRGYHGKHPAVPIHPTLPLLTYVSAPLAYLPALLAGNLPKLQHLHIEIPVRSTIFSHNSEKILAEIVSRLKQRKRHPFPKIYLRIYLPDVYAMSLNLDDFFRSGVGGGTGSPYAAITNLTITGMMPLSVRPDHEGFVAVLAQWLRRFPGASRVSFWGVPWNEPPVHPIYPFLHAIHTQSSSIQTVVITGNSYDVVTTMTKHECALIPTTQSTTRTLGDLNEDIFYMIFEYLEARELYPLSTISRNFRAWVLPVYLWRQGYKDPMASIAVSLTDYTMMEPLTDLSALTLSSIQSTSSLICDISPTAKLFHVFEFLRRLLRLIRKLSTIDKVTLNLGYRPLHPVPEPATETAKVVWTELLVSVLNAIAQKSKTFVITGQGAIANLTLPYLSDTQSSNPGLLISIAPSPMKQTLTVFGVESGVLQLPALRGWIVAALKDNKTISRLAFSGLSCLEIPFVREATHSLSMLTELKIEGYNILPEDILDLLTQFPLLTSLSLEDCNWEDPQTLRPGPVIGRNPHLPHLRKLTAPADYVVFFLERPDALPSLENLKVTTLTTRCAVPVTDTLKTLQSLNDTIERLHSRPRFPTLSFAIRILYLDPHDMTDAGWEAVARWTTTLHVGIATTGWIVLDVTPATDVFRRLLRPWVGLQHLVFQSVTSGELETMKRIVANVKVAELCPNIRTVAMHEINGTVHDLSPPKATR